MSNREGLQRIRIINPDEDEYQSDIDRIVDVLEDIGYDCSREEAKILWEKYSTSMAAGWMHLPEDDDELVFCIDTYFEGV